MEFPSNIYSPDGAHSESNYGSVSQGKAPEESLVHRLAGSEGGTMSVVSRTAAVGSATLANEEASDSEWDTFKPRAGMMGRKMVGFDLRTGNGNPVQFQWERGTRRNRLNGASAKARQDPKLVARKLKAKKRTNDRTRARDDKYARLFQSENMVHIQSGSSFKKCESESNFEFSGYRSSDEGEPVFDSHMESVLNSIEQLDLSIRPGRGSSRKHRDRSLELCRASSRKQRSDYRSPIALVSQQIRAEESRKNKEGKRRAVKRSRQRDKKYSNYAFRNPFGSESLAQFTGIPRQTKSAVLSGSNKLPLDNSDEWHKVTPDAEIVPSVTPAMSTEPAEAGYSCSVM
ncbi:hypothetical protein SCG7086_AE_00250 [Chlamydiales bacterium SCGC AG-110-P3]|nr:hypothetical protein SCG7086_AE_00250 [Chlamydiales bacterium SCGC AG-110-P3]